MDARLDHTLSYPSIGSALCREREVTQVLTRLSYLQPAEPGHRFFFAHPAFPTDKLESGDTGGACDSADRFALDRDRVPRLSATLTPELLTCKLNVLVL